jgi:alpha-tubulin suppressor-like RCC1 family protein
MLGAMIVARVSPHGHGGLARIFALLALVAAPLVDGCANNDDGIVQDTLTNGMLGDCGNGIVEADETCDDENEDARDACTNECQAPVCGDGVASEGEGCDDADDDDADSCTASCSRGPAAVAALGVGDYHVCALSEAGVVRCWGASDYGRLGQPGYTENIGDDEPPSDWDPVEVADDVVELVAGSDHNCALRAGGQLRCWGDNTAGQLGYGNTDVVGDDETPASAGDVPLPDAVLSVAAGTSHNCALLEGGDVMCWGSNESGQLGYGNTDRIGDGEPVDTGGVVSLPGAAVEVVAGYAHSCARLEGGDVVCWGRQAEGQLGTGAPDNIGDDELADAAGPIALGGKAIDIDAYNNHTCAVLEDGGVRCWGAASRGQLGNGDEERKNVGERKTPAEEGVVMLDEPAIAVETGYSHTCALLVNGNVRCWGSSTANGIPEGYDDSVVPLGAARIGVPVQRLWAGYDYNCVVLDSASVRCWGTNTGSVLGYPEVSSSTTVKDPSTVGDVDVF